MIAFLPLATRLCALSAALLLPALAAAQSETEIGAQVLIELNTVQSSDGACTLTFQVINGHTVQIDKVIYEAVLFDTSGRVDRLTLFDFGTLPPARPRVRQFSVPGMACDTLGRLLINGAHHCEAEGLPATACETDLRLESRTEIEIAG